MLLVVEILANALTDKGGRTFEFEDAQGNAVDIEHEIRALGVGAVDGDLFGQRKVIVLRLLPVDQPDGLALLAHLVFDLDAIAQQAVDRFVAVVETLGLVTGRFVQLVERLGNQRFAVAPGAQHRAQKFSFNIAIVGPLGPVAQIIIAEDALEQLHDPILGLTLKLTDVAHGVGFPFLLGTPTSLSAR